MSSRFSRRLLPAVVILCSFVSAPKAWATFVGDNVTAVVNDVFGPVISGSATVGAGVEFTGVDLFDRQTALDISADSFTLTFSKDSAVGNFTGVLLSLVLSNLDTPVQSVTFNAGVSSAWTSGEPFTVDLSVPGQISMIATGFGSANEPATALSHSFTWDVVFASPPSAIVPEPSSVLLLSLAAGACLRRRRLFV